MKNLKIFSINLDRKLALKNNKMKLVVRNEIINGEYDIVMLQGKGVGDDYFYRNLGYDHTSSSNDVVTLLNHMPVFEMTSCDLYNFSITYNDFKPLLLVNVNCKYKNVIKDLYDDFKPYSTSDNYSYIKNRIIAGRFPKNFDINSFCEGLSLTDVSSLVGYNSHILNNRDFVNHFLISKSLMDLSVMKHVGLSESLNVGDYYPISALITSCDDKVYSKNIRL